MPRRLFPPGLVLPLLVVILLGMAVAPATAQTAPASSTTPADRDPDTLVIHAGLEYWVRVSRTLDFDFDASRDDVDDFGWQRIKPFLSLQKRFFELTLQGQDARSHGVEELNPNGTSTYGSRTSRLDFVKAFVKISAPSGVSFKIGREQADGVDLGVSRKLASSSNYGTVLKSFDLASLRWDGKTASVMGFLSSPVDNKPYEFNRRRVGELFWGVQTTKTTGRNGHRLALFRRSTDSNGPVSETGVRGDSATYGLGVQETGPLFVPGLTWEVDGIYQWGHRSTDTLRAAAIFATATHTFSPTQNLWVGYHQSSGDGRRGDGVSHTYDTLYASGYNNYGYMGLSQGKNIGDVRFGGTNKIAGPASLLWAVHEQFLSVRDDIWYAIFTPNIARPTARSRHLGTEVDATLLLRFPWARRMTIGLGYLGYVPGGYLKTSGPPATAHQFAIDIYGQF